MPDEKKKKQEETPYINPITGGSKQDAWMGALGAFPSPKGQDSGKPTMPLDTLFGTEEALRDTMKKAAYIPTATQQDLEKAGESQVRDDSLNFQASDERFRRNIQLLETDLKDLDSRAAAENPWDFASSLFGTLGALAGMATGNPLIFGGGLLLAKKGEAGLAEWKRPYYEAYDAHLKQAYGFGIEEQDREKMAYEAAMKLDPQSKNLIDLVRKAYQAFGLFPSEDRVSKISDLVKGQPISSKEEIAKLQLGEGGKAWQAKLGAAGDKITRFFKDFENVYPYGAYPVMAKMHKEAGEMGPLERKDIPGKPAGFGPAYLDKLAETIDKSTDVDFKRSVDDIGGTRQVLIMFMMRQGYDEAKATEIINNYYTIRGLQIPTGMLQ